MSGAGGCLPEVTFARREDIPDLKAIWMACFGGPEPYLDFYYTYRFVPKDTLVVRDEGRPVAMLTLMRVRLEGRKGYYVYAVATLPWYQGRGLQHRLSDCALAEMKRRGASFCCLVPAEPSLFEFYRELGYETAFYRWEKTVFRGQEPAEELFLSRCSCNRFLSLRREYLAGIPRAVIHPDRELRYIYRELCSFQGAAAVFPENGKLCYAAYNAYPDEIYLREQTGSDPERTARALMELHGISSARIASAGPFPGAELTPYGMGRWLEDDTPLTEKLSGTGYMALMLD